MALFKYAGTPEDLANVSIHNGYVYVCSNDDEAAYQDGEPLLGEWFVDIGTARYRIAAAALIDAEGQVVDINDLVQQGDILEIRQGGTGKNSLVTNAILVGNGTSPVKEIAPSAGVLMVDQDGNEPEYDIVPIGFGGTGATTPLNARANLSVYSKSEVDTSIDQVETDITNAVAEVTTQVFSTTISVSEWNPHLNTETGEIDYYTAGRLVSNLQCGKTHDVPPIISLVDMETVPEEVQESYDMIYRAIADYDPNFNSTAITFYASDLPTVELELLIVDNK